MVHLLKALAAELALRIQLRLRNGDEGRAKAHYHDGGLIRAHRAKLDVRCPKVKRYVTEYVEGLMAMGKFS